MHEFYRGCQDWYQRQNPRWLPSQVIRHARFSGNSTSDLEAKVTKIQAYLRFGICLKFLCCFVLESSRSQTLMCIAMLNSRLGRIFLELILVSFVLGVTKCSLCEHHEPPWPNTQRPPPAESWSVQRFRFKEIRSRQQCCATHPGFISSQASSWLDFGASVPCKTFPVSVWITLTGSSLIWLLSSMGYRTEETQEAACINKSELIFKL